MGALLDAHALSKLKWRCRRGLLENDLLLERFFKHHGAHLDTNQAQALLALMALDDNDLLDLLLQRKAPLGDTPADVLQILRLLQNPLYGGTRETL